MISDERAKRIEEAAVRLLDLLYLYQPLAGNGAVVALRAALALEPTPPREPATMTVKCAGCGQIVLMTVEGHAPGCRRVPSIPLPAPPPAPSEPTKDGMTEQEVWDVLDEAGIDPNEAYDRLREKIPELAPRTETMKRPPAPSELVGHLDNGSEVRTGFGGDAPAPSEECGNCDNTGMVTCWDGERVACGACDRGRGTGRATKGAT